MAGESRERALLATGILVLAAGAAVLAWEHVAGGGAELISAPLLLLGLFLLFEGYVARKRARVLAARAPPREDNPK